MQTWSKVGRALGIVLLVCVAGLLFSCGGGVGCDTNQANANQQSKFAYVTNSLTADSTISIYRVGNADGVWHHIGYIQSADAEPYAIATHPNDNFVYITSNAAAKLSGYAVDHNNGNLTLVNSIATGTNPQSILFSATGSIAFVANRNIGGANGSVMSYHIDTATGMLSALSTQTVGGEPHAMALSHAGNFLYTTNFASNDISIVPVNSSDGSLGTAVSVPVGAGTNPNYIVIDPSGNYAYTANWGDGTVSAFKIDNTTGALSPIGTPLTTGGANPAILALDPTGTHLYVTNFDATNTAPSITAFAINTATGGLTVIPGGPYATDLNPHHIAVDASGKFVYVESFGLSTVHTYGIDPASGGLAARDVITTRGAPVMFALSHGVTAVTPTPKYVYTANEQGNDISAFRIGSAGVLTKINCVAGGGVVCSSSDPTNFATDLSGVATSLAADAYHRFLYSTNYTGNTITGYKINSDGTLLRLNNYTDPNQPTAIDVEPSGRFVYAVNRTSNDITEYQINQATGDLTQVNCMPATGAVCNGNNYAAGTGPFAIKIDPSGRYAYVSNIDAASNDISVYLIDVTQGQLIAVPCNAAAGQICHGTNFVAGTYPDGIGIDDSGRYAYVANNQSNDITAYTIGLFGALYRIDCVPGGTSVCSSAIPVNFAVGSSPVAITTAPSADRIYVANSASNDVSAFGVDTSGALIPIACVEGKGVVCAGQTTTSGVVPSGIAFDITGNDLYVTNLSSNDLAAYAVNSEGWLSNVTYKATSSTQSYPAAVITTGSFQ
jgi:6-phosphogluconolactonase (cycloisomerase 2 family)